MTTSIVVLHRIKDPDAAFARGERLLDGIGAPPGVRRLQFLPARDRSAVMCLWEADDVDALRGYVDGTLGDASENSYFEVDAEYAQGLPAAAPAR